MAIEPFNRYRLFSDYSCACVCWEDTSNNSGLHPVDLFVRVYAHMRAYVRALACVRYRVGGYLVAYACGGLCTFFRTCLLAYVRGCSSICACVRMSAYARVCSCSSVRLEVCGSAFARVCVSVCVYVPRWFKYPVIVSKTSWLQ